jgi:hypothetical protein
VTTSSANPPAPPGPSGDALTYDNGADVRSNGHHFSCNLKPRTEGERQFCLVLTGDVENIGEVYASCVHFDPNAL